jgi:hypothetical protein
MANMSSGQPFDAWMLFWQHEFEITTTSMECAFESTERINKFLLLVSLSPRGIAFGRIGGAYRI